MSLLFVERVHLGFVESVVGVDAVADIGNIEHGIEVTGVFIVLQKNCFQLIIASGVLQILRIAAQLFFACLKVGAGVGDFLKCSKVHGAPF